MRQVRRIGLAALAMVLVLGAGVGAWAAGNDDKSSGAPLKVDLNEATELELTRLPGIGPALAKRIVEFRDRHGPFQRVEDVMKVRGIGERSFEKLRPHLTVQKSKRK
jgi:comEA protein